MSNEKRVSELVRSAISPLIDQILTKKLSQTIDVILKHERGKARLEIDRLRAEVEAHLSKEDLPILRRLRDEKADFARRIDEANPDDRYAALMIHEDVAYLDDLLERLTALVSDR